MNKVHLIKNFQKFLKSSIKVLFVYTNKNYNNMEENLFNPYSNDNSYFDEQYIIQLKNKLLEGTEKNVTKDKRIIGKFNIFEEIF